MMTEAAEAGIIHRISGMRRSVRLGLALALGGAAALGHAPWGLWPLSIVALAVLFALYRHVPGSRSAFALGWAAGTGYFMVALSWIVEPFLVDVARHGWMAPFALILLSAGMAIYWAAAFGIARAVACRSGVALVVLCVLGEVLRGIFFTGFPWAQAGHVWIDTPLLHWASLVGALGLSAYTWIVATAAWHVVAGRRGIGTATLAVCTAFFLTGSRIGADLSTSTDSPVIRLIQPNAPQHEKWDPAKMPIFFNRQLEFSAAGDTRPDMIVWPETSVPVSLNAAEGTLMRMSAAAGGVPVVAGLQRWENERIFNAMVVIGPGGEVISTYDKHHLVPFGEYVPFADVMARFGIGGLAAQGGGGFSAGPGAQVIEIAGLGGALPLICYEGVFARNILSAPERPDYILMITNDAWFGDVSGPYQHLAQARLRSVEQGLPMIRVANTGISAMIDGRGRITHSLDLGEAGWVDAPLPPAHPPTLYARIGDMPIIGLLIVVLGVRMMLRRKRKEASLDT